MSSARRVSNLSLANFKNISPSTTCLYSADSTEPLSLLADSHRVSSIDFCFLGDGFLAILNSNYFYFLKTINNKGCFIVQLNVQSLKSTFLTFTKKVSVIFIWKCF